MYKNNIYIVIIIVKLIKTRVMIYIGFGITVPSSVSIFFK